MCADPGDIAAMDPALVLTVGDAATSLRCVGTLDRWTRPHLVAVVEQMLRSGPGTLAIDVERLSVADSEAANALTYVQRLVKDAGATVRWHGVRADHLRTVPGLDYRARRLPVGGQRVTPLARVSSAHQLPGPGLPGPGLPGPGPAEDPRPSVTGRNDPAVAAPDTRLAS